MQHLGLLVANFSATSITTAETLKIHRNNKPKNGYFEILKYETAMSWNSISNTVLIWILSICIKYPVKSTF